MALLGLIANSLQYGSQILYIDPAATSVLLSSVAAIAVAIAASAIIIWKKVKNNVKKIVKSDPNKNKEVEKDVVLVDNEVLENENNTVKEETDETKTEETQSNKLNTEAKSVTEEEKPQNQDDNGEDKK